MKKQRLPLYSFITFLALSAAFAIACVIAGSFGEFELKVLATTSIIAGMSICALCCRAFIARTEKRQTGLAGIMTAVLASSMLILGIWTELNSEVYWKLTAIFSAYALAFAHALALLGIQLNDKHQWLKPVTALTIFGLASFISIIIINEDWEEVHFKVVAVIAILAALETLVIPVLGRLNGRSNREDQTLVLVRDSEGLYRDRRGIRYEVRELDDVSRL